MKSPPSQRTVFFSLRGFIALSTGLMVGVVFHYALYRLSLPLKPFIYVAF